VTQIRSIRRRAVVPFCLGLAALAAAAAGGCGYQLGENTYMTDVGTVAVPIFGNRAYYKDVQFNLTEAIKKEIEWRTPYKVVAEKSADSVLNGEIVSIQQVTVSRRREGGLPQDVEYRIVVSFEWKDLRSGKVLRERRGMQIASTYSPARQIGQTIGHGQRWAVHRTAQSIVDVMRADL